MKFMECTTCKGIVMTNPTGTCVGCQMGTGGVPQWDAWKEPESAINVPEAKVKDMTLDDLKERQEQLEKELSDANEKPSTESVDACKQAKDGQKVGKGNAKRRKAPKKSKAKEKS